MSSSGADDSARSITVLRNATDLVEEGRILLDSGRTARAYALAHFALEELAKITKLQVKPFRKAVSWLPDVRERELRDHKAKSRIAVFMQVLLDVSLPEGLRTSRALVAQRSRSLYADQDSGGETPNEVIPHEQADQTLRYAAAWLQFEAEMMTAGFPHAEAAKVTKRVLEKPYKERNLDELMYLLVAAGEAVRQARSRRHDAGDGEQPPEQADAGHEPIRDS